jgi:hypothetical protein
VRTFLRQLCALGILILVAIAALLICFSPLYLAHNRVAQHLLTNLNKLPLPPNATAIKEGWNVGGYEGASTLCEAVAFVAVRSNEPKESVLDFYIKHTPAPSDIADNEYYVAALDNLPEVRVPSEISDLAKHATPEDRGTTYAVWIIQPVEDQGWDIRAW